MTRGNRSRWTGGMVVALITVVTAVAAPGESPAGDRPVEAQLNQLKIQSEKDAPPELLEAGRKGIDELIRSGVLDGVLKAGDVMPAFTLKDARGDLVDSNGLLAQGPLVVVFYRGAWCPFCNLYLRSIQAALPEIRARGASLVAISGENPDNSLSVAEKNALEFVVLSDPDLVASRKFGVVYEMPAVTNEAIQKLGFDLAKYYGTEKAELPLTATFVVATDGRVAWAFVDPDYKKRAEPADVLAALDRLR